MVKNNEPFIERRIKSPRSAAIAGIAYALLMITGMILTASISRTKPENITRDTLESWSSTATIVLTLIPFAGIAFLWFTGVIRDRLGEMEDQFFTTIFLTSGTIQVVLLFLWGAVFGAMMGTRAIATVGLVDEDMYVFGFALMNEIIGNYILRMAGVYMSAINTLWTKTGLMPRWLTIGTYILALGFLLAAERIREARYLFPAWVFVVSIYILILNYRRTHDHESADILEV